MSDLDLTRLRCFVAVAEEKHFTRAAVRMHMTPPPLSRQIKRLERELGGALFIRSYHDVQLTPLAEELLPTVRAALAAVDAVADRAAQLTDTGAPLRIAASPFAPMDILDDFAQLLEAASAELEGDLVMDAGTLELTKRLESGALDLALVHLPLPGDSFDTLPFGSYELGLAVRNDDPLAQCSSVTLEDMRGRVVLHPLGSLQPWVMEDHREIFDRYGIRADLDALTTSMGTSEIANQVWTRRIATFIPMTEGSMIRRIFGEPEFVVLPVDGERLVMRTGLAWRRGRAASPVLKRVVEKARQQS